MDFVRLSRCCWLPSLCPVAAGFRTSRDEIFHQAKTAWLTIDDGPDPDTTPQVLALLEKYGARATFFLIGAKAAKYPALTRMIFDAGHTIGNHTQTHPQFSFWRLGPKALAREIDEFEGTISSLGIARAILVSCAGRHEESVSASDFGRPRSSTGRLERPGL